MTNDINTLNGALSELGESMADNLVTMGVTDADASDGLTTLANRILDIPVVPVTQTLTLSSDKSILSYLDSETATLTATLTGGTVSGQTIEFFKGSTSLGTATTDSNGVATMTYSSTGVGDIIFSATKNSVSSNTITIEDCTYYNTTEVSRTTRNGSTIYDNNLSQSLPTNCEISYDIWSYTSVSNSGEHRFFLLPKTKYSSGTTQPSEALYFDYFTINGNGTGKFGKRESSSSIGLSNNLSCSSSNWHTVKYVKEDTTLKIYFDNTLEYTGTISWINNFTDYTISMMRWSTSGTSKIKNVKFKPL